MSLSSSERLALSQFLVYHPVNAKFEEVVQMIRRDSLNIRVKPEFTRVLGSIGDMVLQAEREMRHRPSQPRMN